VTRADRDVRLLFVVGGVSAASILSFFALWLEERGLAADRIGLVLALASLAGVLASPVWSHVADTRLGSARTLQISAVATAAVVLAFLLAGDVWWAIAVVAALRGAVEAPGVPLIDSIALRSLGTGRATSYGAIRQWSSLGWAVAILAFGAVYERFGLGSLPVLYALGSLAFAAAVMRFPPDRPEPTQRGSRLGAVGEAFRASPALLPFLIGLFVVGVAASAAWAFVPLRIAAQGGGPWIIAVAASLAALVEIPFFRASAWLGERVSLRVLYALGAGVFVLSSVVWAVASSPRVIAGANVLNGAGFGLRYAALVVIAGRLVPERLQVTGQALMQTVAAWIGPIVGAAVGGLVYRHLGPSTLFAGAAVGVTVGIVMIWSALSAPSFARPSVPAG
jgi:MFS transporter, PPP family, 3-phenylpropionic acid transporter